MNWRKGWINSNSIQEGESPTLLLSDDFSNVNLDTDKWALDNGSASITEGICSVISSSWKGLASELFEGDLFLEAKFKHPDNNGHIGLANSDYSKKILAFTNYGNENMWFNTVGGSLGSVNQLQVLGATAEDYHILKIIKRDGYAIALLDDVLKTINLNPMGSDSFRVFVGSWSGQTYYVDYIELYSLPEIEYP